METPTVNVIIDVAAEIAADKHCTVREALIAMGNVQIEELLGMVKNLLAGRPDDPRIEDLQKDVQDLAGKTNQTQEWVRSVRQGTDSHDTKIETVMDTVQGLVSALDEHAKEIVRLRQRVGITD